MSWFRNAIANLYDTVSASEAATRLGNILNVVTHYYNKHIKHTTALKTLSTYTVAKEEKE